MNTKAAAELLFREWRKIIIGQDQGLKLMLITFLSGGHALIEGAPGLAKTLMVRILARIVGGEFKRIQLTPDLLPSDLLGTNVYIVGRNEFELRKGPIFTDFLLADEINRTPPKTQSALLEAMEERQVTIDGRAFLLSSKFNVFATQNPIEFEGTYPLPEAQLDRFMMKILIDYPQEKDEVEILKSFHQAESVHKLEHFGIDQVLDDASFQEIRRQIRQVKVDDGIAVYVSKLLAGTRDSPYLILGASPRAGQNLILASKVNAAMEERDYVIPDDIVSLASPVLRHRLIATPDAEMEGMSRDEIIGDILSRIPIPR